MESIGIKTPRIEPGEDLVEIILSSIKGKKALRDHDIVVIASSVVSLTSGNFRDIPKAEPSREAGELAEKTGLDERFVEIIIQAADEVLAPSDECILTMKDGMLRVNAGVDRTNVPPKKALLLPEDPHGSAEKIRERLEEETGKEIGIVISDSHVHPLRLGTTGEAIGTSGFKEVLDYRNQEDLYGRELQITFRAIGDQLAAAAQLEMGEADESVPAVIIRGAESAFSEKPGKSLKVPPEDCVYSELFK